MSNTMGSRVVEMWFDLLVSDVTIVAAFQNKGVNPCGNRLASSESLSKL